jgi:hypothetical protein
VSRFRRLENGDRAPVLSLPQNYDAKIAPTTRAAFTREFNKTHRTESFVKNVLKKQLPPASGALEGEDAPSSDSGEGPEAIEGLVKPKKTPPPKKIPAAGTAVAAKRAPPAKRKAKNL